MVTKFINQVQTTSNHIQPLKIQVKLFQPNGQQAGEREDEVNVVDFVVVVVVVMCFQTDRPGDRNIKE